ncbi:MAG: restriction endonuclease subunit R [Nitrosomonadaceae bacterium]|nr:restriction endonuclease subunit R [Nitrosomonadaceae bacterium]
MLKSTNFEILREQWPDLASLGGFAENYVNSDPSSSIIKLRSFAEKIVNRIYAELDLPKPIEANLNNLLNSSSFSQHIPDIVIKKLHAIRIHGNKAAHGELPSIKSSSWLIREAYDLAKWLFITFGGAGIEDCPQFQDPPENSTSTENELKKEKREALEELAKQEVQTKILLSQLESEKSKNVDQKELDEITSKGHDTVNILDFDEKTTRQRLIDSQLTDAGWNVGDNGTNTSEVTQEEEVQYQPTQSGLGYADYVLWDDNGKPLAVVEVKKTVESAEKGRTQARIYADGLEKMHGQRPVIFYTNGYDIYIWDDAQGYPDRTIFGFYSKDSLQYLIFQRKEKKHLDTIKPNLEIADRLYQQRAIKEVLEKFTAKHRKALIVQATGTGKTRVAICMTDILSRASWSKRVLFLCDRKELRKQAKNVFNNFMGDSSLVIVKRDTSKDRNKRIYLATYQAMMQIYQSFDIGFFDLIIADESHRSIYNRYREMFRYYDCLQVGLTATPVDFVSRNTYGIFGCEERQPTAHYPYEDAVKEGYLVPFEVYTHTTQFLRGGIKYENLTEDQKRQLEEDGEEPETFDYEAREIDKQIYNKDTNRHIIRNLMENGIKEATGQHPGKTIVFARNHNHAILLMELFNEMYPQYSGKLCQVIDNYDPRAEQLIDDFKDPADPLTIAISVDMLDTGIDVPEVVNLVFAKPVKSRVKFWQMIGRGTRLCKNLFGIGKDKKSFYIFDHWQNFEYFNQRYQEAEPKQSKPLLRKVFEARIDLAETALNNQLLDAFEFAAEWIQKTICSLDETSISVREKWREKRTVEKLEVLRQFAPTTVDILRTQISGLMQWVNIRGEGHAYHFDLLISNTQIEIIKNSGLLDDYKGKIINLITQLPMHLNPVREKSEIIKKVKSADFWSSVNTVKLEEIRKELRGIIKYIPKSTVIDIPKTIDISDGSIQTSRQPTNLGEVDKQVYRNKVVEALKPLFNTDPTLIKIRQGQPVNKEELSSLTSLVLTQHPDIDLSILKEFYAQTAMPLDFLLRSIVGMESSAVEKRFLEFVKDHPNLNAKQLRFMNLLQNHITNFGTIEVERLYETPFINIDNDGLDGIFPKEQDVEKLISIIDSFKPSQRQDTTAL